MKLLNIVRAAMPALVISLVGWIPPAVSAPTTIGNAASTRNQVECLIDGKQSFLYAGNSVFRDEIVHTGPTSLAQLLLLDHTSLGIGPNSQIKLDKFVFDPVGGGGNVVLEATRGAFRFITGSQDPRNYTIKTPVATIGVRGTIIHFSIGIDNGLQFYLEKGVAILTLNDGQTFTLTGVGQGLQITGGGKPGSPSTSGTPTDPLNIGWSNFYNSSVHDGLDNALALAGGNTQAELLALRTSIEEAIGTYGGAFTEGLIEIVIADALLRGLTDEEIGQLLAQIAMGYAQASGFSCAGSSPATTIAQIVANEGTSSMIQAFVNGLGGLDPCLAAIATGNPQITKSTGNPSPLNQTPLNNDANPPCPNPSCS